jgi:hypothetical protein
MPQPIDDIADELRYIAHAIKRLGMLRPQLTPAEQVKLAEQLRDAGDALDHGLGAIVTLPAFKTGFPSLPVLEHPQPSAGSPAPQPEQSPSSEPATDDAVRVPVRPLGAKHRAPTRPARPRMAAD